MGVTGGTRMAAGTAVTAATHAEGCLTTPPEAGTLDTRSGGAQILPTIAPLRCDASAAGRRPPAILGPGLLVGRRRRFRGDGIVVLVRALG